MRFIQIVSLFFIQFSSTVYAQELESDSYFPPIEGVWEKAQTSNLNSEKVQKIIEYTKNQNSSGLLILDKGRILVEEQWTQNKDAHTEDVASIQKSVISLLCGIAISKGLLNIDKPVNKYVKEGWSNTNIENENNILIKHLLSMTSGLNLRLNFRNQPGKQWLYNTGAYSKLILVLESITKKTIDELTNEWLSYPIGINNSNWQKRVGNKQNPYGFYSNLRDLGRLGLLVLNKGKWGDLQLIPDSLYLSKALQPSQKMNIAYGYLFWLNTTKKFHKNSPIDLIIMAGASNKFVFIFPSEQLVVVRLGKQAEKDFHKNFLDLVVPIKSKE